MSCGNHTRSAKSQTSLLQSPHRLHRLCKCLFAAGPRALFRLTAWGRIKPRRGAPRWHQPGQHGRRGGINRVVGICSATRVVRVSSALPNSISVAAQFEHLVGARKNARPNHYGILGQGQRTGPLGTFIQCDRVGDKVDLYTYKLEMRGGPICPVRHFG